MNKYTINSYFKQFICRHKKLTALLFISTLLSSLSILVPPLLLEKTIDILEDIVAKSEPISTKLIYISIGYFFSFFLSAILTFVENYYIDEFCHDFILDLRYKMMQKVYKLDGEYLNKISKGDINSRIIDDVYAVEKNYTECLIAIIVSVFRIMVILVTIFISYWLLGLITLVYIPIIFFISNSIRKRILKLQLLDRDNVNKQSSLLYETLKNHFVIHSLNVEKYIEEKQYDTVLEQKEILEKASVFDSIYSPIIKFLEATLIGIIALLVDLSINKNFTIYSVSVGTFAAFVTLIGEIFEPIQEAGQELENLQEGVAGIRKVIDFLNLDERRKQDETLKVDDIYNNKCDKYLNLDDMSFKYDDGDYIYTHVNLNINEKDKVLIKIDTNDSKKSLSRLFIGDSIPQKGTVKFKGVDTYLIPDRERAKLFGCVEPVFEFIEGTIKDQITLREEKDVDIDSILKKCLMYDRLYENYKSLDEPFDEKKFSYGELQLLLLARVLYFDPKIILLDELDTSFDKNTADKFIKILLEACIDKTIILISHSDENTSYFNKTYNIIDKTIKAV